MKFVGLYWHFVDLVWMFVVPFVYLLNLATKLQPGAERMATVAEQKREGIGKYLVVYLCILALAGLQFVIAYQNITASQMFRRMLSVAMVRPEWR